MIRLGLALLILLTSAAAEAKPRRCFTSGELTAEREVRHGIFLREATKRCDARLLPGATKRWQTFEEANGARFRAAVSRRQKAWQREFPDDWLVKQTRADGQIVTYARHQPVWPAGCADVVGVMCVVGRRGSGGWGVRA